MVKLEGPASFTESLVESWVTDHHPYHHLYWTQALALAVRNLKRVNLMRERTTQMVR